MQAVIIFQIKIKVILHYILVTTRKHVTSGEAHLRGLALGQLSFEETLQRRRAVGYTVSDLTGPGILP